MTIKIHPEDEKLIQGKLRTGVFRSADELIHRTMVSLSSPPASSQKPRKNFSQFLMESPLRGPGLNPKREKGYPRPIELGAGF